MSSAETNQEEANKWLTDLWWGVKCADEERDYYNNSAANYENFSAILGWIAPQLCMEGITKYETISGTQIPRDGRAIDIGAGTGLSGQALRDIGFTGQIDALEPTENMFVQAQPKNIFTLWYHELLLENKETSVPSNTYDLVYSVGVFSDRSAKSGCLKELVRLVKPGGHIAVNCLKRFWHGYLEVAAHNLQGEGKIEIKHVELFEKFHHHTKSVTVILQKNCK
ncbi:uncharacterized protein LOC142351844 [Convolutriloba macropyga]|uniref:uncharacterized protein LOC142351844 n=1 Tax=Convolutriloba macropyga TaxID=536237 RepID=UPI003F51D3F1